MAAKKQNAAKVTKFENPFREGTSYHAICEALVKLGIGKDHAYDAILKAVKAEMAGGDWKAFKNRESRNENGLDADNRILTNLNVLTRSDYGQPIREKGFEIRRNGRERVGGLFRM